MAAGSPGLEIIHVQAVQMTREDGEDPEGDVQYPWLRVPKPQAGCQLPWGRLQGVGPIVLSFMSCWEGPMALVPCLGHPA